MFEFLDEVAESRVKQLVSACVLYGGLALLGGLTRVALGIQKGESVKNAILKYGLVSLPVGVLTGWGAESICTAEFFPFAVSFLAGHISYNIVTHIEQNTTKWFIQIISKGKLK